MNRKLLESYVINDVIIVVKESKGYRKGKKGGNGNLRMVRNEECNCKIVV